MLDLKLIKEKLLTLKAKTDLLLLHAKGASEEIDMILDYIEEAEKEEPDNDEEPPADPPDETEDPPAEEEPEPEPETPVDPLSNFKAIILDKHNIQCSWAAHVDGEIDIEFSVPDKDKDKNGKYIPWKHSVLEYTKQPIPILDHSYIIWVSDTSVKTLFRAKKPKWSIFGIDFFTWYSPVVEANIAAPKPKPAPESEPPAEEEEEIPPYWNESGKLSVLIGNAGWNALPK